MLAATNGQRLEVPKGGVRTRGRHLALMLSLCTSAVSCGAASTLRPVVSAEPAIASVEWTVDSRSEAPATAAVETQSEPAPLMDLADFLQRAPRTTAREASARHAFLGAEPAQLDPGLGPIDLGYPLLVDLGAGDAPYDDGVPTIHVEEPKRSGFSDSVIQVTWRERLTESTALHGGAAIFRYQDLSILDGLSDARFGFAVVGIQFRL